MTRYIHNKSQSNKTYAGQTVTADSFYQVPENLIFEFSTDNNLLSDIANNIVAISEDGSTDITSISDQIDFLKTGNIEKRDISGRAIRRFAATAEGWHYQLLSVEVKTAKLGGFYNKDKAGSDLGFVTYKLYDVNNVEITEAQNEVNAVKTIVLIRPTYSFEIIGAIFGQAALPANDIYLWVTGLPGVADVKFSIGGINLRHAGIGAYQLADGRAAKYLAYNAQVPDANSFELTAKHAAGEQHSFQLSFEVYKAP